MGEFDSFFLVGIGEASRPVGGKLIGVAVVDLAVVVKTVWGSHFGSFWCTTPILGPKLVGIGMFTGG